MTHRNIFSAFLTTVLLAFLLFSSAIAQNETIDFSGTWKGEFSVGTSAIAVETYLIKTGDNSYSGVNYQIIKTSQGQLSQQYVKKALRATYNGRIFSVTEYALIELTPNTPLLNNLSRGDFFVENKKGEWCLVPVNTILHGQSTQVSKNFPEEYKAYFNRESQNQAHNNTREEVPERNVKQILFNPAFIGNWTKTSVAAGTAYGLFDKETLEFEENGVGISRNKTGNTINSISLFNWYAKDGVLNILEKGKEKTAFNYTLHDNTIVLQQGQFENAFKKTSSNSMENYQALVPPQKAYGNWAGFMQFKDEGRLADPHFFYNIYPTSDNGVWGEIIVVRSDKNNLDSLDFIKYNSHYNASKDLNNVIGNSPIIKFFNNLDPNVSSANVTVNNYVYSFEYMNGDQQEEMDCYYSDNMIILNRELGRYYLIKIGAPYWTNVPELHKKYNAGRGSDDQLMEFGKHWVSCIKCGGTGKISTTESVDAGTDMNGNRRYRDKEVSFQCPLCNGNGGALISDQTAQKQ